MVTRVPLVAALLLGACVIPAMATPKATGSTYDIANPGLLPKSENMLAGLIPVFTDSDHSWYNNGGYYESQPADFACLTDGRIPDPGDNYNTGDRALISKDAKVTWTWPLARPLESVRIFTHWPDGYRNDVSVELIEVRQPDGTWTPLAFSAFSFARRWTLNTLDEYDHDALSRVVTFADSEGALLAPVITGLRITFGDQSPTDDSENTLCYGSYWEIEAKGPTAPSAYAPFTGGILTHMLHLGVDEADNPPSSLGGIGTDLLVAYGGERTMTPCVGDVTTLGGRDYVWTELRKEGGHWFDIGRESYVAYFHIYFFVDGTSDKNVRWHFAHDDGMRVWLNGEDVHIDDGYVGGDHTVDGVLHPGINSVMLKLEEGTGGDFLYAALYGPGDSALDGVYYSPSLLFTVKSTATGVIGHTSSTTVDVETFPIDYLATHYMVTDSDVAPTANDPRWTAYSTTALPSQVTFPTPGTAKATIQLNAWLKDASGTITRYPCASLAYQTTPPVIGAPDAVTLVRPKATGVRTIIPGELYTNITTDAGIHSVTVTPESLPAAGGDVTLTVTDNGGLQASKTVSVTLTDGFGPLPNGWITQFLHLGTKFDTDDPAHNGIDYDHLAAFGGQANQNPYHGLTLSPIETSGSCSTPNSLTWTAMERQGSDGRWQPYFNDSRDYYNKYWHIYVISPVSENRPVRFVHSNDDELRVWVNGTLQISHGGSGYNFITEGTLYPGLNSITLKLHEGGGGDYLAFAIQKPDGSYYDDLTYSLDPPDEFYLACVATSNADFTCSPTVNVTKFPLVNGATACQITFSSDASSIDADAWVPYTYGTSPFATVTFPDAMFAEGDELVCYAWFQTGDSLRAIASAPIVASVAAPTLVLHDGILDAHADGTHTVDPYELIASIDGNVSGLYRVWADPAVVSADGTVAIHAMNQAGVETIETADFILDRLESIVIVPDEFSAAVSGTAKIAGAANFRVRYRYALEGAATTNEAVFAFDAPIDGLAAFAGEISGLETGATYLWWAEALDNGVPVGRSSGSFDTYKIVVHGSAGTICADVAVEGDDIILTYSDWGKIEFKRAIQADVLLVGGGGGGGVWIGGGGGGGGVVYLQDITIPAGKYVVNAGAGGVGASWDGSVAAANGENSSIVGLESLGLLAIGGGAGGGSGYEWRDNQYYWGGSNAGGNGGSGGGASGHVENGAGNYTPGTGIAGQGNGGGASVVEGFAGGGGGAGAPGGTGNADDSQYGGKGGDGVECAITGEAVYYGGGGGGGCSTYGVDSGEYNRSAPGGLGGGGNGGYLNAGSNGAASGLDGVDGLGGGGGGGGKSFGYNNSNGYGGGHGGKGVVIIRFTQTYGDSSNEATGGDEVLKVRQDNATYMVHVFRNNGTFEIPDSVAVDVLVIGGGGAGGSGYLCGGGGGGAGGVIRSEGFHLPAGVHEVVVGAGGSAKDMFTIDQGNGTPSSFVTLTALGGGGGGSLYTDGGRGSDGASGGGAAGGGHDYVNSQSRGGTAVEGQGNPGAANVFDLYASVDNRYTLGSGGGGAGTAGHSAEAVDEAFRAGAGGDGVMCDWTGSEVWYAGGGGGGNHGAYWCETAPGGKGGGGNGGNCNGTQATAGAPGTGAGGGGGYMDYGNRGYDGGNGGSGIVIIRYPLKTKGLLLMIR